MAEKTSNQSGGIYDYLNWRGDLSFENVPPCEVDNLIFSMISYVDFSGVVDPEVPEGEKKPIALLTATKRYLKLQSGVIRNIGLIIPKEIFTLLLAKKHLRNMGILSATKQPVDVRIYALKTLYDGRSLQTLHVCQLYGCFF